MKNSIDFVTNERTILGCPYLTEYNNFMVELSMKLGLQGLDACERNVRNSHEKRPSLFSTMWSERFEVMNFLIKEFLCRFNLGL